MPAARGRLREFRLKPRALSLEAHQGRANAWEILRAGGVVELGRSKGVPTPLNRAIADILELHASGKAT
jgi:ketopantoate reductase